MKFKSFRRLMLIGIGALLTLSLGSCSSDKEDGIKPNSNLNVLTDEQLDKGIGQYLGYGYDITSNEPIYSTTAMKFNNPILDVKAPELRNDIVEKGVSSTNNFSKTCSSVTDMINEYSKVTSAGTNTQASVKLGSVAGTSVNIGAIFNKDIKWTESETVQEEYQLYSLYAKNTRVSLQTNEDILVNHLTQKFKDAINNIRNVDDAAKLYKEFGTHLLTGYELGGIFEISNYFASNMKSYVRQQKTGLKTQVDLAANATFMAGSIGGKEDLNYSFTEKYGLADQTSNSINEYKFVTHGGKNYGAFSLEQIFARNNNAFTSGYLFNDWTESINNGENLAIVNIPSDSKMIPLYNLVPLDESYSKIREYMMDAYIMLCKNANAKLRDNYHNIYNDFTHNDENAIPELKVNGLTICTKGTDNRYLSNYMAIDDIKKSISLKSGSLVSIDYDKTKFYGHEVGWEFTNSQYITWKDQANGIFEVKPNLKGTCEDRLICKVDGTQVAEINFKFNTYKFSGGLGTLESPYLLSTSNDIEYLSNNNDLITGNYYFKLISDIDISRLKKPIGSRNNTFNGVFDGNSYSLLNMNISIPSSSAKDDDILLGLFGCNNGVIKNLTINSDGRKAMVSNVDALNQQFVTYAGIIAGWNTDKGEILNCKISNASVSIVLNYDKNKPSDSQFNKYGGNPAQECYVGGIVGKNEGLIKDISINKSEAILLSELHHYVGAGGIAGLNASKGTNTGIINVEVDQCCVFSRGGNTQMGNNKGTFVSNAGGICGLFKYGKLSNAIVKNMNDRSIDREGDPTYYYVIPYTFRPQILSYCIGWLKGSFVPHAFSGGVIGQFDNSATATNPIELNDIYVNNVTAVNSRCNRTTKGVFYSATMFGLIDNVDNIINIEDLVCETGVTDINSGADLLNFTYNGKNTDKKDSIERTIKVVSKATYSEIKNNTTLDEAVWNENTADNSAQLKIDSIANVIFDTSKLKKEFQVGEEFYIGNINIIINHTGENTSQEEAKNFHWSTDYDSTVPGEYIVRLYCHGFEDSYKVVVKDLYCHAIEVIVKNPDKVYNEMDTIDLNDFIFKKILSDGSREILDSSLIKYSFTEQTHPDYLVEGVNNIVFTYGDKKYELKIVAEKLAVSTLTVENTPDSTIEYEVGLENIDLNDIIVKVKYANGKERVLDKDEYELVYNKISTGENIITVVYNFENIKKFTVRGKSDIDEALKRKFINAVDVIDSNADLAEQLAGLKNAYDLYNKFIKTDVEIDNKLQELEAKVNKYNNIVNNINNDFKESIHVEGSMNNTIIENFVEFVEDLYNHILDAIL